MLSVHSSPSNIAIFLISLSCSLTDFSVVSQFALRNTATESSQQKHKVCEKHYFSAIVSHMVTLPPKTSYLCIEMEKSSYHSSIDRPSSVYWGKLHYLWSYHQSKDNNIFWGNKKQITAWSYPLKCFVPSILDSVIRIWIIFIETIRLYDKCNSAIWWQKSSVEGFPLDSSCSQRRWAVLWRTTSVGTLTVSAQDCVCHKAGAAPPGSPCAAGWWPGWWVLAEPASYLVESPALSPAEQSFSPCPLLFHSSLISCHTWCSESGTGERKHT